MVEIFAKWPSERGQPAKVGSSEGLPKGMEFPWRCNVDTIAMDLKVSWEMSGTLCHGPNSIASADRGRFLAVLETGTVSAISIRAGKGNGTLDRSS